MIVAIILHDLLSCRKDKAFLSDTQASFVGIRFGKGGVQAGCGPPGHLAPRGAGAVVRLLRHLQNFYKNILYL